MSLRDRDGNLTGGTLVELRWAPSTRAGPSRQSPEVGLEQALLHQPVEVELRRVPGHADAGGRLVPADRITLAADVEVEVTSDGLDQRANPGHSRGKVVR